MSSQKLKEHYKAIEEINNLIDDNLSEGKLGLAKKGLDIAKKLYKFSKKSPIAVGLTSNRIINNLQKKAEINNLEDELEDATSEGEKARLAAELTVLLTQLEKAYAKYPGIQGTIHGKGYDIDGVGGEEYQIPYDQVELDLDRSPVIYIKTHKKKPIKYKLPTNATFQIIATKSTSDGYIMNLDDRDLPFDSLLVFSPTLKPNKKQRLKLMGIKGKYRGDLTNVDGRFINFV